MDFARDALNRLPHVNGNEYYGFRWEDKDTNALLRHIGRMACAPDISFDWLDAHIVARKVLEIESRKRLSKQLAKGR